MPLERRERPEDPKKLHPGKQVRKRPRSPRRRPRRLPTTGAVDNGGNARTADGRDKCCFVMQAHEALSRSIKRNPFWPFRRLEGHSLTGWSAGRGITLYS